jgi:5S rRNA maturation endonuclease (ribonuclease M5)
VAVPPEEILAIKGLISDLNSEQNSAIVVEGKRDAHALKSLGLYKEVLEFHKFCGLTNFSDSVFRHETVILLFDSDRKGRYLTKRVIGQLAHRTKINLSYKKRITQITQGRIKSIEDMACYCLFLDEMTFHIPHVMQDK